MDLNFPTPQNHAPNFCCFCELQSPRYSVIAIGNKLKRLLDTPHQRRLPEHFLIQFISIYKVSQAMIGMLRKGQILSFWPVWTDQNIRCLFFFYPKWVDTWAFKDICLSLNKWFSSLYKPFMLPISLNPIGSKHTLSKTQHTIFLDDLARGPQGQEAKDQAFSCCCSMLVPLSAHSWRGQKAKWAILSTLKHLLSILYV